jgi:hypothetical protein
VALAPTSCRLDRSFFESHIQGIVHPAHLVPGLYLDGDCQIASGHQLKRGYRSAQGQRESTGDKETDHDAKHHRNCRAKSNRERVDWYDWLFA